TPLPVLTDLSVSFRAGVRSFSNIHDSYKEQHDETSTIRNSEPSSWWKKIEILPRPWGHEGVDGFNIPDEEREGWECTRKSVAQVAASVLGTAGLVAREILVTGLQLANFVPIPGLQPIASTLLKIWDAVQLVGTNRLAFLRLTQRCANALLSVWQEIEDAGRAAIEELSQPLDSLNRVFTNVLKLAEQQSSIPFLMRYLKRNEIVSRITELNKEVVDALQMFGTSVQIRTLKLVQLSEEHRQADAKVIKALITAQLPSGLSSSPARRDTLAVPGLPPSSPQHPLPTIIPSIHELYSVENSQDNQRDVDDLRQLMRTALRTGSDAEMISLQIAREEMPEAIKSLQRALEIDAFTSSSIHSPRTKENEPAPDLLLHREFIESGIDALRRMSKGLETELPSWTITKYEVEPEQKIGMGYFSDVYKGTWKGQTVAIKVLAELTPRKLFVREMGIWKALRHQNVIELFGTSSATGEAPWFFVSPYEKNGNLVDFMRRCTFGKERNRLISEDKKSMVLKEKDLYRFMMEIAEGMAYLHARGILHGDLKASNVLVDDDIHCVISDFGQSELKSEVCRISGMPLPGGTLRWQAPELLLGHGELISAVDIYAYAISCIEVLSFGQLPWPLSDDDAVRYLVLKEKSRPCIPAACTSSPMQELIRKCWDSKPERRPSFVDITYSWQPYTPVR
ncbi:kinase-like domain-containing protein, partial [Cyathus striatus]